jgi:hypothetical protein
MQILLQKILSPEEWSFFLLGVSFRTSAAAWFGFEHNHKPKNINKAKAINWQAFSSTKSVQETTVDSSRSIRVILTSEVSTTVVLAPKTFHEADKLFFLKISRLKGPMSLVLAVTASMT